mgnify:CR=1 FL=1
MKIDPSLTRVTAGRAADPIAQQRVRENSTPTNEGALATRRADQTILSPQAQEMLYARRAYEQEPGSRQERVAALKRAIAEGTYTVNAEKVVDKMISGGV